MLKSIAIIFSLAIIFSGCSTSIYTVNLYKAPIDNKTNKYLKIGYSKIEYITELNKIFSLTDSLFTLHLNNTFSNFKIEPLTALDYKFNYNKIDPKEIAKICETNNLDGILVPFLKFFDTRHSIYFIPVGTAHDADVEMKFYDKNGVLLLDIMHNTKVRTKIKTPIEDNIATATNAVADRIATLLKLVIKPSVLQ